MSFNVEQFKNLVERTTTQINACTQESTTLLLGTCAVESGFGTYLKQVRGPALGVFQMEPNTEKDIWINYIQYRQDLTNGIHELTGIQTPSELNLEGNLIYQILMCRIHYLRVKEPIPDILDIVGMGKYWKKYYNTPIGKGDVGSFIKAYNKYIRGTKT